MSTLIKFPFQKKEGKYFAPIVSEHTTYKVDAGAVVANAGVKKELYALNAETVFSSQ